jgi:hypothetical protein
MIYGWQFPDSTIRYVGKTNNPVRRYKKYMRKANPNYVKTHKMRAVHLALRSEWSNIEECKFVILAENLTPEEAKTQEAFFIEKYNTFYYGLNKTRG